MTYAKPVKLYERCTATAISYVIAYVMRSDFGIPNTVTLHLHQAHWHKLAPGGLPPLVYTWERSLYSDGKWRSTDRNYGLWEDGADAYTTFHLGTITGTLQFTIANIIEDYTTAAVLTEILE